MHSTAISIQNAANCSVRVAGAAVHRAPRAGFPTGTVIRRILRIGGRGIRYLRSVAYRLLAAQRRFTAH